MARRKAGGKSSRPANPDTTPGAPPDATPDTTAGATPSATSASDGADGASTKGGRGERARAGRAKAGSRSPAGSKRVAAGKDATRAKRTGTRGSTSGPPATDGKVPGRKPPTPRRTRATAPRSSARKAPAAAAPTPPVGQRGSHNHERQRVPTPPSTSTAASTPPAPTVRAARDASASPRSRPSPPSEFGPSIDPGPSGLTRRIVAEVLRLERGVRDRLAPVDPGGDVAASSGRRGPLDPLWQRWRQAAMARRSEHVDDFGRDPKVAERVAPLLDFLYRSYFRVDVRGMGHIPDQGRGLIVANHSGTLPYDSAMIMHAVRSDHPSHREVRPLTEDFVFHFPYLGTLINRIGGVRACQENAQRLLEQDQLVAVFPEGIKGISKLYAQRYQLQRFGRGGFIKLALATDSPIIPAAVIGAEEVHPMLARITWLARAIRLPFLPITPTFPWLGPLGLLPLPSKWMIAFGAPLYFTAEYGAEAARDRVLVNKMSEQVRQRIQEMIDELRGERRSPVFG